MQTLQNTASSGFSGVKRALAGFLLVCCIAGIELTFFGGFRLGYSITVAVFVLFCLVLARQSGARLRPFGVLCAFFAAALAGVNAVRYDAGLFFFFFLAVVVLLAAFLINTFGTARYSDKGIFFAIDLVRTIFYVPFRHSFAVQKRILSGGKYGREIRLAGIGIAAGLPVAAIVISLLRKSDAAFEGLLSSFADSLGHIVLLCILGVALYFLMSGLLFGMSTGMDAPAGSAKEEPAHIRRVDTVITGTLLGILAGTYLVYLFSQLAYFFSAFSGILPAGYQYSTAEYARRGFFEMCAVAAINLAVLTLVLIFTKQRGGRFANSTRLLSLGVACFTLLLITTALSKMVLYIHTFGLTRLRLLTSCFMVVVFAAFVLLIIRLFARRFAYMRILLVFASVLSLCIGYVDIDSTVLAYNLRAYETGALETLDVAAFAELGDAKIPYLIALAENRDADIRTQALRLLAEEIEIRWQVSDEQGEFALQIPQQQQQKFYQYNYTYNKAQQQLLTFAKTNTAVWEYWCEDCGSFRFRDAEHWCAIGSLPCDICGEAVYEGETHICTEDPDYLDNDAPGLKNEEK